MASSFRIVVVGDIHEDWEFEHDYKALKCLQPELVLFTGDFGNENVELVRSVAKVDMPKAAILGNHDSWVSYKFSSKIKDGVQLQLEALGDEHVGYGRLDFPALKLSVVGGRPFSCGGDQLFRKRLLKSPTLYKTIAECMEGAENIQTKCTHVSLLPQTKHNQYSETAFGLQDLAQAISLLKETSNYSIPLVVFGHMHKNLLHGGSRKMISIGSDSTMYLNTAIVPRVKHLDSEGSARAFTVVDFRDGKITKVVETWVSVLGDKMFNEEHILFHTDSEVSQG